MEFAVDYSKMTLDELNAEKVRLKDLVKRNNERYSQNLATKASCQQELDMLNEEEKSLVSFNTYLNNQIKLVDKAIAEAEAKLQMQ